MKFKKTFDFNHEWPLGKEDTEKDVTEHSVIFDNKSFPVIPYIWVREEIDSLKAKLIEKGDLVEGQLYSPDKFPVIFDSYDEMLKNCEMDFTLPESGTKIKWSVLSGEMQSKYANVDSSSVHINTPISMRNAKQLMNMPGTKEPVLTKLETGRQEWLDLEAIREEIKRVEGSVNTLLSIKHPEKNKETRIDLVTTVAFFVPSQAL